MKRKEWTDIPPGKPKAISSGLTKIIVQKKTDELILADLKPAYIQSLPENPKYNHVKDIYAKWRGSYFYFYAIYFNPYLDAISPIFDSGFARIEYTGENQFDLSSMRYTGQWQFCKYQRK